MTLYKQAPSVTLHPGLQSISFMYYIKIYIQCNFDLFILIESCLDAAHSFYSFEEVVPLQTASAVQGHWPIASQRGPNSCVYHRLFLHLILVELLCTDSLICTSKASKSAASFSVALADVPEWLNLQEGRSCALEIWGSNKMPHTQTHTLEIMFIYSVIYCTTITDNNYCIASFSKSLFPPEQYNMWAAASLAATWKLPWPMKDCIFVPQ